MSIREEALEVRYKVTEERQRDFNTFYNITERIWKWTAWSRTALRMQRPNQYTTLQQLKIKLKSYLGWYTLAPYSYWRYWDVHLKGYAIWNYNTWRFLKQKLCNPESVPVKQILRKIRKTRNPFWSTDIIRCRGRAYPELQPL